MRRKTELEMAIQEAKKVARTVLRLKYSILAEREINEALPDIEADIKKAAASGVSFEFDAAKYFGQLED